MNYPKVISATLGGGAVIALLAFGLGKDPRAVPSMTVGKPAPQFTLETLSGDTLRMSDLKGQVVVMNFWASWCVACVGEHPVMVETAKKWDGKGVRIVGLVYQDNKENAQNWMNERGGSWTNVLDRQSRTAIELGLSGVPETYFIGKDGRVAYKHIGPITAQVMESWIPKLLAAS